MMVKKTQEIRVRIAPSPTGHLHIGTARTALFNFLFARQHDGKFILRIEDTDTERSKKEFEQDIIDNLGWLGIAWDEGPIRQTARLDIYEQYLHRLLEKGGAYYCFCKKEDLESQRQELAAEGLPQKYSGLCRAIPAVDAAKRVAAGEEAVIRFRIPEQRIHFKDLVRGEVSFDGALIGDVVIAKNLRAPLYDFAAVVDDAEMKISHVIRGEDHLSNTAKQICLQEALGLPRPEYAHLPLILNPDRSKMSKRFAATSIKEYREQGYLPEAMLNFTAFLGWHPKGDKELLTKDELIQEFDITRVQKGGAIFNVEKLNWFNAQYFKKMSDEQLAKLVGETNLKVLHLVRDKMKKLSDYKSLTDWVKAVPDYESSLLLWKETSKEKILENLRAVAAIIAAPEKIKQLAEERGKGEVFWPLRAALSGKDASPGPLELIDALGVAEAKKRVDAAIKKLTQ